MTVQDWVGVISFVVGFGGVVYAFGERDNRLKRVETDLNKMGTKYAEKTNEYEGYLKRFDERLDKSNEFRIRADQRLFLLEERVMGEETAGRLRGMPPHYTADDEAWKSDNSGIEL